LTKTRQLCELKGEAHRRSAGSGQAQPRLL
jgi:hypothetical protein